MNLGQRLKLFVTHNWDKQSDFIFDHRVNPSSLQKYMKGDIAPSSQFLTLLSNIGCNLHWLLTGEGEMYNDTPAGQALRDKNAKS